MARNHIEKEVGNTEKEIEDQVLDIDSIDVPEMLEIEQSQEKTRRFLAIFFPVIYASSIIPAFICALSKSLSLNDAAQIYTIFLSPIMTVNGMILGFYFAKDFK